MQALSQLSYSPELNCAGQFIDFCARLRAADLNVVAHAAIL